MSDTIYPVLCTATASIEGAKLHITVFKVEDGLAFKSGHGERKFGSPRRWWTPQLIQQEIGIAFGAKHVEISKKK